jgi:hypothetical protein
MIRRTIWTLNFLLVGLCGYIYGVNDGMVVKKEVDMQMQIQYAVVQALLDEGN